MLPIPERREGGWSPVLGRGNVVGGVGGEGHRTRLEGSAELKAFGAWHDASSPGWMSSRQVGGRWGILQSYPSVTHDVCQATQEPVHTPALKRWDSQRHANSWGNRLVVRTGAVPGVFFPFSLVCPCEIGGSSSFRILLKKRITINNQTRDLSS